MKITDVVSITELSRLLNKSRPTVYKYVSDFENGNQALVPLSVRRLFKEIQAGNAPKRDVYEYCDRWFMPTEKPKRIEEKTITLKEIIKLLKDNERGLDLKRIKEFIEEEIQNV